MNQHQNIASVTLGSVADNKQVNGDLMQFSMIVQLKPNTAQDVLTPGFGDTDPTTTDKQAPASPTTPLTPIKSASAIVTKVTEVHHV
jgi:hypothetical protein